MRLSSPLAGLVCLLAWGSPADAAEPTRDRVVLIDLSEDEAIALSFDAADLPGASDLERQCSSGRVDDAGKIKECAACNADRHSTRWISEAGDRLRVFVVYLGRTDTPQPAIGIKEERRRTRLATDLGTALRLVRRLAAAEAAVEEPVLRCFARTHLLIEKRARVTVTAEVIDVRAPDDPAPAGVDPEPPAKKSASLTLLTGPKEHLFLSADLPVRRLNQVTLAEGGLEPSTKPTRFFVGVNYAVGDLFDDRPRSTRRTLIDNLVGRVMVEASSSPLESLGVALALRGSYLASFGLDFDTVSPFVGAIWSRDTASGSDRFVRTFQWGFSFNLDRALTWLQND